MRPSLLVNVWFCKMVFSLVAKLYQSEKFNHKSITCNCWFEQLIAIMFSNIGSTRFVCLGSRLFQSIQLATKPQFTGAGPFIELPTFNALGKSSNLLNVTIPSSSYLSIKSGSLVAIDGDLDLLVSYSKSLPNSITYSEVYTQSPVSIILNGNDNYSVIDIEDKSERWLVLDATNVIAWSGYTLELEPISIVSKLSSLKSQGKGTLVLQGSDQLFNITVEEGEQMLINPNTLIATNSSVEFCSVKSPSILSTISWPKITFPKLSRSGILGVIPGYYDQFKHKLAKQLAELGVSKSMDSVRSSVHQFMTTVRSGWDYVKMNLFDLLSPKPIYVKVQGPCKLLIKNTPPMSNRKMFTKQEIHGIFKR